MASEQKPDHGDIGADDADLTDEHEALAILAARVRPDPERAARMIAPASDVEVKGRTVTL